MNTSRIEKILQEIKSLIGDDKESIDWFNKVRINASTFETDEEEIAYLEDILIKLQNSDDEEIEDTDEAQEPKKVRPNPWPTISLFFVLAILIIIIAVTVLNFLSPKKEGLNSNANSTTISQTLPKEEFKIVDFIVSANEIKPNPEMETKNQQHKVFANGSLENSLSSDKDIAIKEMIDYMSHNVSALKEKAMTFNLVDQNFDEKKWLENRKGQLYYNKEGQDVFYQVKAFLNRSKITSKVMEEGSNYYTTGLNKDNKVVVSQGSQDLSGQRYLEVKNPEGSTEKYHYNVLVYCGNTVMKNNNIPGVPKEKIEIPKPNKPGKPDEPGKPGKPDEPGKPGKPDEPGKPSQPSESKVEKKDSSKDPANQGKAPIGGGKNDGSANGLETSQANLPEQYPTPAATAQNSSATAPSQDARVSEPSQWVGAGTVTDSNGTTKVTDSGAVTTPDGRNYSGLTDPSSVPPVESGANGSSYRETKASSSANFANSSMSEPAIDD